MATYYNLKSLEGLNKGDRIEYTTNISDVILSGYTVDIRLHGKNGNSRTLNTGYSYTGVGGYGGKTEIVSFKVPKDAVGFSFTMNNGVCMYSGKTTTGVLIAVAGNGGSSGTVASEALNHSRIQISSIRGGNGGGTQGGPGGYATGGSAYIAKGGTQTAGGKGGTISSGNSSFSLNLPGSDGSKGTGGAAVAGYANLVNGTKINFSSGYGGDGYYGGGSGSLFAGTTSSGDLVIMPFGGAGGSGYFNKNYSDQISEYSLLNGESAFENGAVIIEIVRTPYDDLILYKTETSEEKCEVYYHDGLSFKLCSIQLNSNSEFSKPIYNAVKGEFEIGG